MARFKISCNYKLDIVCIVLFTSLILSCSRESPHDTYLVDSTQIIEKPLSDLIKIHRIIPLETNDSSVIQRISSIKKRNGRYYIISKYRPYIFDHDGRFLFMPSRPGQGPGEYQQQVNCIDADNNYIYLYAPPKLIYLTLDGKFVKEKNVDWGWGGVFRKIPNGFLTVTENMPDSTHIGFYDNDLIPVVKDAKFKGHMDNSTSVVWAQRSETQYVQNGGFSTDFYVFDTTTNNFSQIRFADRDDGLTVEDYYNLAWQQGKSNADIYNFMVSSPSSFGHDIIWFCKDDRDWQLYYLKDTNNTAKIIKPTVDDLVFLDSPDKILGFVTMTDNDENKIISILNMDEIDFASDNFVNGKGIFSKLKDISQESNPVIIEFEIK